jgi:hypothetical protein
MTERFRLDESLQRLDLQGPELKRWLGESHFVARFRQQAFSRAIPTLRNIGMITPRVRAALEHHGLLRPSVL